MFRLSFSLKFFVKSPLPFGEDGEVSDGDFSWCTRDTRIVADCLRQIWVTGNDPFTDFLLFCLMWSYHGKASRIMSGLPVCGDLE